MNTSRSQRGAGLLMLMVSIVILATGFALIKKLDSDTQLRAQNEATARALLLAREALIGYAVTTEMSGRGPGNLLCPDDDNDGKTQRIGSNTNPQCSGPAKQAARLGRVPWATLGAPEILDGSGERLWYAVSDNFRNFDPAASNSNTSGTITVRDASGRIMFDGSTGGGVAAVIIAPGPPLAGSRVQHRPGNTPLDYLDTALGEDNAGFTDGTKDGFIMGPVRTADGRIIANDRVLAITRDELLAATEKRVVAEVRNCLMAWAEVNSDQFPPPAPVDSTEYRSIEGTLFGRVPKIIQSNPSASVSRALSNLLAARNQLTASSSQTQPAAMRAMNRANNSLIIALSGTSSTASSMAALSGTALLTQIEASALDPLVTANGQTAPASELVGNPALWPAISNAFTNLALATSDTMAAARRIQQTEAKTVKTLTGYIDNTLTAAAAIQLANRSTPTKVDWSITPIDCKWLDPERKNKDGADIRSGWARNDWIAHTFYQIDRRRLERNPEGNPAPGTLTVNGGIGTQLVVLAAGRALIGQTRNSIFDPARFFEGLNAHASRNGAATNPSKAFEQRPFSEAFNDQLAY